MEKGEGAGNESHLQELLKQFFLYGGSSKKNLLKVAHKEFEF